MYHLNEKMYPNSDRCYKCLCTEHFDNSSIPENSSCERVRCLPQLSKLDYLRRGCTPIFAPKQCCAREFKCRRFQ